MMNLINFYFVQVFFFGGKFMFEKWPTKSCSQLCFQRSFAFFGHKISPPKIIGCVIMSLRFSVDHNFYGEIRRTKNFRIGGTIWFFVGFLQIFPIFQNSFKIFQKSFTIFYIFFLNRENSNMFLLTRRRNDNFLLKYFFFCNVQ